MDATIETEQPAAAAPPDAADLAGFEYAIVEVFGHRSHAGRAREEERFGSKMMRIDALLIDANGTVSTGSNIGMDLYRRGLVHVVRFGRYGLTPAGEEMIRRFPESGWKLPADQARRPRPII